MTDSTESAATQRFVAPSDVTSVFLTSGPVAVIDGAVEVPLDLSQGDRSGLAANGFTLATTTVAPPAPVVPPTAAPSPEPGSPSVLDLTDPA